LTALAITSIFVKLKPENRILYHKTQNHSGFSDCGEMKKPGDFISGLYMRYGIVSFLIR